MEIIVTYYDNILLILIMEIYGNDTESIDFGTVDRGSEVG